MSQVISESTYLSYIRDLAWEFIEREENILNEYYKQVNNEKDRRYLNDMKIQIYFADREEMTPHLHIIDGKGRDKIEIEVSLIDWSIVNVKTPNNVSNDWSNFTDIRDRFFKWLPGHENQIFRLWNHENPDNTLDEYATSSTISDELKSFLKNIKNPLDFKALANDIYNRLSNIKKDSIEWFKLSNKDELEILKYIGIVDDYDLADTYKTCLQVALDTVKKIKNERSFNIAEYKSDLYVTLCEFYADPKRKQEYRTAKDIDILKASGLYEKYHLDETTDDILNIALTAVRHLKLSSY